MDGESLIRISYRRAVVSRDLWFKGSGLQATIARLMTEDAVPREGTQDN